VAWEGILLGYSNDFSCYKILRVEDRVVVPTRNVRFDEETFPAIMSSATNILPIFQMDPVLPFKDSEILNDDSPTREEAKNDDDSEPMEPFPEELESGKWWVYVSDHQPSNNITSIIDQQNIAEGKRA
jgi:hypothetical protein